MADSLGVSHSTEIDVPAIPIWHWRDFTVRKLATWGIPEWIIGSLFQTGNPNRFVDSLFREYLERRDNAVLCGKRVPLLSEPTNIRIKSRCGSREIPLNCWIVLYPFVEESFTANRLVILGCFDYMPKAIHLESKNVLMITGTTWLATQKECRSNNTTGDYSDSLIYDFQLPVYYWLSPEYGICLRMGSKHISVKGFPRRGI